MSNPTLIGVAFLFLAMLSGHTAKAAEPDKKELAKKVEMILKANCYHCHGQLDSVSGGFNYVLNPARLIESKKVVPGKPEESKLFEKMLDGVMPPATDANGKPVKQRPSRKDISLIEEWIEAGAADFKK